MKILRAFKLMAPLGLSPVPMPSCKSSTYHQILLQTTRVFKLLIILLFLLIIIILLTILTRCTCFCPPSPSPTSPSQSTDPPELKSPLLDKRFSHIQLLDNCDGFCLPMQCTHCLAKMPKKWILSAQMLLFLTSPINTYVSPTAATVSGTMSQSAHPVHISPI